MMTRLLRRFCSRTELLQQREAKRRELAGLVPPDPLDRDMCCGSGCSPCVMETYYEQEEDYERRRAALESALAFLEGQLPDN